MCCEFILATDADFDKIWLLFKKAIQNLQINHIDQWDEHYPNKQTLTEDIEKQHMYVMALDGNIVSVIVLNEEQNDDYDKMNWTDCTGKFAVFHRLCVHPDFQNRGIGRETVISAERHLAHCGYTSIRLDAFLKNEISLKMYEGLGYMLAGNTFYEKGEFGLYEKKLVHG